MSRALLALFFSAGLAAASSSYEISDYRATVTVLENSADVDVSLEITYLILSGSKYDGFKFVGTHDVSGLSASDEHGAIDAAIRHQRETQLYWTFIETGPGTKRVEVRFRLHNALSGTRARNAIDARWIGTFRVPVRHAVIRLLLPAGSGPEPNVIGPGDYTLTTEFGRPVLTWVAEPLTPGNLWVAFSPGVVDAPEHKSNNAGAVVMVVIIVIALFVLVKAASRADWNVAGGNAGGDSGSSGGCGGGGCGGGGCGGGCGG